MALRMLVCPSCKGEGSGDGYGVSGGGGLCLHCGGSGDVTESKWDRLVQRYELTGNYGGATVGRPARAT